MQQTAEICLEALRFCVDVALKEWDHVKAQERRRAFDILLHGSKKEAPKYPEFDIRFSNMPAYMRRALIADAVGMVKSYRSNHANWEAPSDASRSGRYHSILVDRNYTVHINSENENELKQIYQAFLYPPIYPSLGRWEDTIRIDEVKIVNVEDEEKEEKLKAFSWLPREKCPQEVIGTIYKIPTFYTIFYERRIFDYKSCYIGNIGSSSIIRLDENGEQVLFV